MPLTRKFSTKEIALIICFTALYTTLSFIPISPIIGVPLKAVTAAAIIAPIIGMLLGPYAGTASTILGGIIGFFAGAFSLPSLVSGATAALHAGVLRFEKRILAILIYGSLLLVFSFYPSVGPVWLFPPLIWFQIAGLLILISPLQNAATKTLNSGKSFRLLPAFFVTALTSTLAGQIAGSLTFEAVSWPALIPNLDAWKTTWLGVTFLYPLERTIIAVAAALIGTALYKVLNSTNWIRSNTTNLHKTKTN